VEFRPLPCGRPTSLIRSDRERFVLRLQSQAGERMATRLRPMTVRDALRHPFFYRRSR
jgi:hypothetical protein